MRLKFPGAATVLLLSLIPQGGSAHAQQLEVVPQLGLYVPTRVTLDGDQVRVKQKVGVSAGFRLGLRFGQHFGIHTGLRYIPGHVALTNTSTGVSADLNSHILAGDAGLDYWILPRARKLAWVVRVGLGAVSRGGSGYADFTGRARVAGAVGVAMRLRFGRVLSLHWGLDDYLYRADFTGGELRNPRTQHDLHFTFGLGIPLIGLGE